MTVNIETNVSVDFDFDYEKVIKDVINEACDFVNCPFETEVNVLLVDNEEIKEINKEQRNIDNPTDVLSFPFADYDSPEDFSIIENDDGYFNPETGELILGDIVISVDKVKSQAKEYNHGELREIAFLTAHSMLHLFGHDHMEDDERLVMEDKQRKILDNLSISR